MEPNRQTTEGQTKESFYNKHSNVSVISKKTEKITTAIYMVTDFMSDSEPLKKELRTLSVGLITNTRKLVSKSSEPHLVLKDEVVRMIGDTTTFITLATTIGLISEMNGSILKTELGKIEVELEKEYGGKNVFVTTHPGYANIILEPAFFEVEKKDVLLPGTDKGQQILKGHDFQNNVLNKTEVKVSNIKESFSQKNELGLKIARRNDVLSIVRNKVKVSIKDISFILKDMSEKTIQRELHALVSEGVLIKEGEKRWSVYRIAQ